MPLKSASCALLFLFFLNSSAYAVDVAVCTDLGRFDVELFHEDAPMHATNFLEYVDQGYYSGTVFHRVIPGFVVQGGGFNRDLTSKRTGPPVQNESRNGLSNARGTLSAARTSDPHSATSQFYINLENNAALDAGADWGYTVFGRVTSGMDIVEAIAGLPTGPAGNFSSDVPEPLVGITTMTRLSEERLSDVPLEERYARIEDEISDALDADDYPAAADWFVQYRIACGPLEPALLRAEADAAFVLERPLVAKRALEDFFRVADGRDRGYEEARALYRERFPEGPEAVGAGISQVTARCTAPEAAPSMVDGATATLDEMVEIQTAVRAYLDTSDAYVSCLAGVLDEDELADGQRPLVIAAHNDTIKAMEDVAEAFNEQVRAFRDR